MAAQLQNALTILRRRQLEARIGLKRSSLYSRLDPASIYFDPEFPKPIKLGANSVGWVESEVDAYIQSRINARRCHGLSTPNSQSNLDEQGGAA